MRTSILGLSAIALFAASAPAIAQDEEKSPVTITGGATVVSDYRFRGVSQSNEDFAIQGSVTLTHESGAYVGFWGSSNAGQGEIDVIGGYSHEIVPGITGDIGVTYYLYPNRKFNGYTNGAKGANELVEPYVDVSATIGPVSGKVGFAWAPKQDYFASFDDGKKYDNTYLWFDASAAVPNTPIKVNGHVGWTSNHYLRSVLYSEDAFGNRTASRADVIDFGVGASASYKALTFGVNFVTTDLPGRYRIGGDSIREGFGMDNTVVFSLGASF